MQLLTQDLREKLLANGRQQRPLRGTGGEIDFMPVVKLFTPDAGATWLLTEIDPEDRISPSVSVTSGLVMRRSVVSASWSLPLSVVALACRSSVTGISGRIGLCPLMQVKLSASAISVHESLHNGERHPKGGVLSC